MKKIITFTITGALSLTAASSIQAAVFTSIADTYIRDSSGNDNFGGDAFMVANDNNTDNRIALFSFDMTSVSPGTITSAKLELEDTIGNASQNYELWGLLDADEAFDESTLTWNTAGFLSGTTVDSTKAYGGAMLGTFSNSANTVNTIFDVTSGTFLDFLNASSNSIVTFVIVDPSSANAGSGWATKEDGGSLAPTLTTVVIPEPASAAALFGFFSLLLALRRRR